MSDPSLALQDALIVALKADAGVAALVGTRIYDDVPTTPTFPYISYGEGQVIGDDLTVECGDASEVFAEIHVWSRAVGFPQAKNIAAAVRAALRTAPTLSGFTVSVTEFRGIRPLRDPDGLTKHVIVEFRYLIHHTS